MFIRATSQRDKKTGRAYITHRLVESYRNQSGQVRQHTLLNLGVDFPFPKEHWKSIADRVEEILGAQDSLFEFEPLIEKEAQRIAKLLTKNMPHRLLPLPISKVLVKVQTFKASTSTVSSTKMFAKWARNMSLVMRLNSLS